MPDSWTISVNVETKRLILRAVEPEDASFLADLVNDPEVRGALGAYSLVYPVSVEEEEKWVAKVESRDDESNMVVCKRQGMKPIGLMSVRDIRERVASAHVTIILAKEHWDKGFGQEAMEGVLSLLFDRMNLHRVWLRVAEDNKRAIRCYEKCGFLREGVLREDHFQSGKWANSLVMAILADEFRRRHR